MRHIEMVLEFGMPQLRRARPPNALQNPDPYPLEVLPISIPPLSLSSQDFLRSYRAVPAGPTPPDRTPSEPLPPHLTWT